MLNNIGHRDPGMAFVINAFPIGNEQDLGRLVRNGECFRDFVRNGTVVDEVEVVEVDRFGRAASFQSVFHHGACGAAGTVLEDNLGASGRSFLDLVELLLFL